MAKSSIKQKIECLKSYTSTLVIPKPKIKVFQELNASDFIKQSK